MNCLQCVSRKVCFLQKQMDALVGRATDRPFIHKVLSTKYKIMVSEQREKTENRRDKMERELRGIIASYCPLYIEKPK